jgi:hypothetical protein
MPPNANVAPDLEGFGKRVCGLVDPASLEVCLAEAVEGDGGVDGLLTVDSDLRLDGLAGNYVLIACY